MGLRCFMSWQYKFVQSGEHACRQMLEAWQTRSARGVELLHEEGVNSTCTSGSPVVVGVVGETSA